MLRAAAILEWIASCGSDSRSLGDIARGTGISKATCHAFVLALASAGFLLRDDRSQRYRLGPMLVMLGKAVSEDYALAEHAQPECRKLEAEIGRPVLTAVTTGSRIVIVSATTPLREIGIPLMAGQSVPFVPPMGAVFVAWRSETEIEAWLDKLPDLAPAARASLRKALSFVRHHGCSVTFAGRDEMLDLPGRVDVLTAETADRPADLYRVARDMASTGYLPTAVDERRKYQLLQVSAPIFAPEGVVDYALVVPFGVRSLGGREILETAERVKLAAALVTADRGGSVPSHV